MTTVEQNVKAIKMCHELGLKVKAFIIVRLPSESWETVEETRKFLEETRPDDVDITIYTPFKGTEIYENREQYDIKFNINDLRMLWFKGRPGSYRSLVSTSKMSSDDIIKKRYIRKRIQR